MKRQKEKAVSRAMTVIDRYDEQVFSFCFFIIRLFPFILVREEVRCGSIKIVFRSKLNRWEKINRKI